MNAKIEIDIDLSAPRARVFEALTLPSELEEWFAEKAYVSTSEKRYDFWGRFTPGNPGERSGRHLLHVLESPRKLAFDWRVRGQETRVEIELEDRAGGKGTTLKLTHDAPPRESDELSLADFWLLSLENLRRRVEEGKSAARCDYSLTPRGAVELSLDIDALPRDVFRALTREEDIDRWMTARSEVELVPGGKYRFGWTGEGPVRILDVVPDEKLCYTWEHGSDPETVVTWTLEGSGGATRLLLVHSGFGERDTEDFRTGWLKHVLWMRGLVEKGAAWAPPRVAGIGCAA
jgi:uncharacterized protein YndB with AHSA1/START domain